MAEIGALGKPHCATCAGRGILTDLEGRPTQCVPCSSEHREAAAAQFGYSLECRSCTAVLTIEEIWTGKAEPKPWQWSIFGPLCRFCMKMERKSA